PGRREPGHGRRLRRRTSALALGTVRRRGLCDLDGGREAARADPRRERAARPLRLAAAGPLLTGAHRHSEMSRLRIALVGSAAAVAVLCAAVWIASPSG